MCELLKENITWYRYRVISHHADVWGPGGDKLKLPYCGLKFSDQELEEVLSFILSPDCIQNLAYGEKRIVQSDGTEIFLPNFQRVYDVERMWNMFQQSEHKINMGRSTFTSIVKLVTGGQQSKMAALDMITVRYGFENFLDVRELINLICLKFQHLNNSELPQKLLNDVDNVETFLKSEFKQHLRDKSECASHCIQFSLSDKEDRAAMNKCKHRHKFRCHQCDSVHKLYFDLKIFVEEGRDQLPLVEMTKAEFSTKKLDVWMSEIAERVDVYYERTRFYLGHIIRGHHEDEARCKCAAQMELYEAQITADWKMKQLTVSFREPHGFL